MFASFRKLSKWMRHYKQSRDLRYITPDIVQCHVCENATLLAIKQLRKITIYRNSQKIRLINQLRM